MEDEKESGYTDSPNKLIRINWLLQRINEFNLNLLEYEMNQDGSRTYRYHSVFEILNTLFSEVSYSCTEKEKKEIMKLKEDLIDGFGKYSPHTIPTDMRVGYKPQVRFDSKNWWIIKKLLSNYDLKIRNLIDRYFRPPKKQVIET